MNILETLSEYAAVIFGLVIGTLAHFGRLLADGDLPTWGQAIGYIMQLGFIGIVAVVATRTLNITDGDMRALATAILAISAQEVIRYMRSNGWGPFVRAVSPEDTLTGEQRQAEQKAKAIRYLEEHDLLDDALQKLRRNRDK